MQKKAEVIFARGMYVGKNTAQAASVEFVHVNEQIMRAADWGTLPKKDTSFFGSDRPALTGRPVFLRVLCFAGERLKRISAPFFSLFNAEGREMPPENLVHTEV